MFTAASSLRISGLTCKAAHLWLSSSLDFHQTLYYVIRLSFRFLQRFRQILFADFGGNAFSSYVSHGVPIKSIQSWSNLHPFLVSLYVKLSIYDIFLGFGIQKTGSSQKFLGSFTSRKPSIFFARAH